LKEQTTFQDLRQFLFHYVATYDELEVLLLLQGQAELAWTINTVAQELGSAAETCQVALENLAARGLLVLSGNSTTFRYAPASKALNDAAEQLQRAYRTDRFAIVHLMTTNAMDRIRAAALERLGGVLQLRDWKERS
jgi:hypothetical protein